MQKDEGPFCRERIIIIHPVTQADPYPLLASHVDSSSSVCLCALKRFRLGILEVHQ